MFSNKGVFYLCLLAYLCLLGRMEWAFVERTQPISSVGAPEEQLQAIQTASNFIRYGFFTHLLLTDYSTSRDPAGHPVVYTHMPSGQNILLALLMKLGLGLVSIRFCFIGISFLGLIFFFLFFAELTGSEPLALMALITMSFSCDYFLSWSDQICHASFWLAYGSATFFYLRYARAGKKADLWLSLAGLSISLLTVYVTTFSILGTIALFHLFLNRKSARSREYLRKAIVVALCLVSLNIVRNALVLGPVTEAREILYTISNRMTGWPSRRQLSQFFADHNIVLWGVDASSRAPSFASWVQQFYASSRGFLLALTLTLLAGGIWHRRDRAALLRALLPPLLPAAGLFGWYFFFPAHGRGYFLPYLEGVLQALMVLATGKILLSAWETSDANRWLSSRRAVIGLLAFQLVMVIGGSAFITCRYWTMALARDFNRDALASLGTLPPLEGKVTWTNINPQALSFFTRSEIVGNCTARALQTQDLSGCFAIFRRDWRHQAAALSHPDYILYSRTLVAGNMDCTGGMRCEADLLTELSHTARLRMRNEHWLLYELPHPNPAPTRSIN